MGHSECPVALWMVPGLGFPVFSRKVYQSWQQQLPLPQHLNTLKYNPAKLHAFSPPLIGIAADAEWVLLGKAMSRFAGGRLSD